MLSCRWAWAGGAAATGWGLTASCPLNLSPGPQVAIYGRTYIEAAKKASDIVQSTGVDALVNDDLVGSVLTMVPPPPHDPAPPIVPLLPPTLLH